MGYKQRRRKKLNQWKVAKRCVVFFTAICVVPVLLVLLVTTDQYMRPVRPNRSTYFRPEFQGSSMGHRNGVEISRNMTFVAERIERRRRHLKRACAQLGLDVLGNDTLHKPNPWEFLVDKKHHLVWCNVFKAASSSWMYNFNLLAGYSPQFLKKSKLVPMNLARERYPRQSLKDLRRAFNDSISFIIVRHPLERLLSAYRDKLQYSLPHTHHRKLGNDIISRYRKDRKNRFNPRFPTFEEFVRYFLDSVKRGETLDMHWVPITEFCTPCMYDFDVIAHTETLQEDQEYLIQRAGLQMLLKPQWKNPGRGSTTQQIEKFYSQLTRAQILRLYHIYRYDFELFNYSLKGYLEAGRPDSDPSELLAAISLKEETNAIKKFAHLPSKE